MTGPLPPLSVAGRVDRVRARLAELECDALAVHDLTNVRWCTGFTGSNALLVITMTEATLITDGRYATQAPEEFADSGAAGVSLEITNQLDIVGAQTLTAEARIALEADVLTWSAHDEWEKLVGGDLVATAGIVKELRAVKDEAELVRMGRAAQIVDETLAESVAMLVPGTTEREMAHALEDGMRRRGATGPAYETIVASGPNGALPHARPGDRAFADGDLVVIDAGALVEGYRSDMTRTFCVGEPDPLGATIHGVVTRAQAAGVAGVRAGIETGAVDDICRALITEEGYGEEFSHGTGHGVGLDIHELPAVRKGNTAILQPGHVITVEPGIYVAGVGGVRVEDMVVVTDDGCRPLTQYPKEPLCPPSPPTT